MRKLTLGWLLDGMLIQLIVEKRKNTKQKKFLSKFPKNINYENNFSEKTREINHKINKTDCITSESGTNNWKM